MDLFEGLPDPQFKTSDGKAQEEQQQPATSKSKSWERSFSFEEKKSQNSGNTHDVSSIVGSSITESPKQNPKRGFDESFHSGESQREPLEQKHPRCDIAKGSSNQNHVLPLKGFYAEMQGERDEMEDAHVILDNCENRFNNTGFSRVAFFGVFDGHNGSRASHFAVKEILDNVAAQFANREITTASNMDQTWTSCLLEAFKATDAAFLKKASFNKPPWKDGSTATVALIVDNKAYLANVGDSKAVLCRYARTTKDHKAITLTLDHNPILFEERQRIQQHGGFVRDGRLNGILEGTFSTYLTNSENWNIIVVSRSLGDFPYKRGSGLISIPSIQKCSLTEDDRFIIIACDGLWKALTPAETVAFVLEKTKECSEVANSDSVYISATTALAKEALKRLSGDNVTVILVRIN